MTSWQEQNNQYLAASLQWLRRRLTNLLPVAPASPVAESSPASRPLSSYLRPKAAAAAPLALPSPSHDDEAVAAAAKTRAELARIDPPPALCMLAERLGLSDFERDTLLLCAAVEIDPGFATLFSQVQGTPSRSTPTFALALQLLDDPVWDALSPQRPLRYARLVELIGGGTSPLTTTSLRADERIVHYIKGLNAIDDRLNALLTAAGDGAEPALAPSQQAVAREVIAQLQVSGAAAQIPLVQLTGDDAGSQLDVARLVCHQLNRYLYCINVDALPTVKAELDSLVRLWQRERLLLPIALYLDARETPGTATEISNAFYSFISADVGLTFVGLREPPARAPKTALSFEVAKPTAREQFDAWTEVLPSAVEKDSPQRLAGQFDLNLRDIRQSVAMARTSDRDSVDLAQIWNACRRITQPRLDQLAQRLEPKATWKDLVLSDESVGLLRQIAEQVRNRFRVYEEWGYSERMTRGRGISALFAGESGTGKTMAAEVLANELQLSLYRIDLSAVVSKYIGETEKNLRRLFDAAEQGGAILFFDEADALFGKRSEVKDSHDRYANIEINYLLQRMEAFSGLAILATNMKSALDVAFMRRLRFIVNLPYPGPAERRRMWELALPSNVPREPLDMERLARLGLSGGNIHSIALNAAFMAAARDTPVTQALLMTAARTEVRKLGRQVSEAEFR